ncbi:Receptor-like kinase [Melia azedarach]|uniref:Receptor-like kinase n=2 Tax=Melia azedarach TaxID=155640 RepID=A0ACC1WZD3_MELAZ|nr:Receptor-like kinase [Melia azedarach]KAJ4703322.1 Receptor-like kinase [Melia azedarach]
MSANTNRVVGTFGYTCPEYALDGLFSMKSDVCSFGVLLLEIISGKKNTSIFSGDVSSNSIKYAWELWRDDKALEIVDSSFAHSCPASEALRCVQVGLVCVQDSTTDSPSMSTVVFLLSNEIPLPVLKQTTFAVRRVEVETDSTTSGTMSFSVNEVGFFTQASLDSVINNISVQTVVWVANRETPVKNFDGILKIGVDGNLAVFDGNDRSPLWSTNVSVPTGTSIAKP